MGTPRDILHYNREAWNREVAQGNPWTIPVSAEEVARARRGDVRILLTPSRFVPRSWFPPEWEGVHVLCLASGGGQQAPLLAAAGAQVTVLDNSPAQLARDEEVAAREGLTIRTVLGDMANVHMFADNTFDLIVHPVSNTFVPDVRPVWREAYRVLRPGGALLAGFTNPICYLFDEADEAEGRLVVRYALPRQYMPPESEGGPLEWSHTLDDQIGGQLEAGFLLAGFFEDRYDPSEDLLSAFTATFIATRAIKPNW